MAWILILVLVGPDATWYGYTYPQRFATERACQQFGAGMTEGDGDNEHAICARVDQ